MFNSYIISTKVYYITSLISILSPNSKCAIDLLLQKALIFIEIGEN